MMQEEVVHTRRIAGNNGERSNLANRNAAPANAEETRAPADPGFGL